MKAYYIGYYSDTDVLKMRKGAPSADTKAEYVISALKNIGYDVEILSWCSVNSKHNLFKRFDGYLTKINGVPVRFFDSYTSKFCVLRIFGRLLTWQKQKRYIRQNCLASNNDIVIYHSLVFLKLYRFLNQNNKKYALEMEEIYADVINNSRIKVKEIEAAHKASGYIFPTLLLDKIINIEKKPSVIVHGTYKVESDRNKRLFDKEHIHCVYAGTFDPRKGGCVAAATAAKFLPSNYHMHIIGFGNEREVSNIKKIIAEISEKTNAKVTYDGLKSGEEYIQFLQSCDIGLSTQDPDAAFNATSFPSKVLSYLANGLRVVSIKIPAIEQSSVGGMLYYYEKQTPEELANAILSVNLEESYDSRARIQELDVLFTNELKAMLDREI